MVDIEEENVGMANAASRLSEKDSGHFSSQKVDNNNRQGYFCLIYSSNTLIMQNKTNLIASIGLAAGFIFGLAGSFLTDPILKASLFEISSVGLTLACALLAVSYMRQGKDFVATGFLLFAIAEAAMSVGTAAGEVAAQPSFAAGMALYVPALFFISVPKHFPGIVRILGVAAAIPFGIAASKIYMGEQVLASAPLVGAAYGLLTLTIIGWIFKLLFRKEVATANAGIA